MPPQPVGFWLVLRLPVPRTPLDLALAPPFGEHPVLPGVWSHQLSGLPVAPFTVVCSGSLQNTTHLVASTTATDFLADTEAGVPDKGVHRMGSSRGLSSWFANGCPSCCFFKHGQPYVLGVLCGGWCLSCVLVSSFCKDTLQLG